MCVNMAVRKLPEANSIFFVKNTEATHKRCLKNNIKPTFAAYEMQLVKRDDNYLTLVELENWKAGGVSPPQKGDKDAGIWFQKTDQRRE